MPVSWGAPAVATETELTAETAARTAADLLKQDAATAATDTELAGEATTRGAADTAESAARTTADALKQDAATAATDAELAAAVAAAIATKADLADARFTGVGAPIAKAANFTFALADMGGSVHITNAAATTGTLPPNGTVAIPVGSVVELVQKGAGACTWTPGAGVTLRSKGGLLATGGQYAASSAEKIAADEWLISGDLA